MLGCVIVSRDFRVLAENQTMMENGSKRCLFVCDAIAFSWFHLVILIVIVGKCFVSFSSFEKNDRVIVKEIDLEETERIDGGKEKVEREISGKKERINLGERDLRKNIWGRI